ncbi:DUF5057 domain-containing protein [Alkalihalobacillus sp. LMS39]|uniref:DUF5057 domain-containing protein n=1 Tax=Alkalihalobacillus sp. LMS39 TaxID=2924032 RepID=UPI001FB3E67D|nr:DUF5057 domain-containing protein [Alkalihalobacillus sp. LMS39]UOE93329.1 DUF5057 domain-containing protein [Alkalihalobacillus sp. LMS39]
MKTLKGLQGFIVFILIFSLGIPQTFIERADANSPTSKIEVLEITDTGSSVLQSRLNSNFYNIHTVRMKEFVSLRYELDGKYDMVFIANGTYSPTTIGTLTTNEQRIAAHNTTNVMNDITNLKLKEIEDDFLKQGQFVVVHSGVLSQRGKLGTTFTRWNNEKKYSSNLRVITQNSQAGTVIGNFFQNNPKKPAMNIITKPTVYSGNSSPVYRAGDVVSFEVDTVQNGIANLYIDADFNHYYEEKELVGTAKIVDGKATIHYKLPKGFSGLRYWKFEVIDASSNLKSYDTGAFKFRDEKMKVRVLQVLPTTANLESALDKSNNMNQQYLSSEDYQIEIDIITMTQFNNQYHRQLNGVYDMLIFGFVDEYNVRANLNDTPANSVKTFIATGQSVMFTHDTIYRLPTESNWGRFMEDTGQVFPRTNMGLNAVNPSRSTKRINTGLLTTYPFELGDSIEIATTHNQYYTLDLEDRNVIPWYNIIGSNRDIYDSWNHYYTYSKGNVTYSGTGHTNTGFPDQEQKLFVNTMYRAFIGSNHAPMLNVLAPKPNATYYKGQLVNLVYEVYDYDLTDHSLKTEVFVNNQRVFANDKLSNPALVRTTLSTDDLRIGENRIRIEATDESGAKVVEQFSIFVDETEAVVNRYLSKENVLVNETTTLHHQVDLHKFLIWDHFDEQHGVLNHVFPIGVTRDIPTSQQPIDILSRENAGKWGYLRLDGSGNSALRQTVQQAIDGLGDLSYAVGEQVGPETGNNSNVDRMISDWLRDKGPQYVNVPVVDTFEFGGSSTDHTIIGFATVKLTYRDGTVYAEYDGVPSSVSYPPLRQVTYTETLSPGIEVVNVKSEAPIRSWDVKNNKLTIYFEDIPFPQQKDMVNIGFDVEIKPIDQGRYLLSDGKLNVITPSLDQKSFTFNEVVLDSRYAVQKVEVTSCPNPLQYGEEALLQFAVYPEQALKHPQAVQSAQWISSNRDILDVDATGKVKAKFPGHATIQVRVNDVDNVDPNSDYLFSEPCSINVSPLQVTLSGPTEMYEGDSHPITIQSPYSGPYNVTWTSSLPASLTVSKTESQTGSIQAKASGSVVITATGTIDGIPFEAKTHQVAVKEIGFAVEGPSGMRIGQSETISLIISPSKYKDSVQNVTWTSSHPDIVSVQPWTDTDARVVAKENGIAEIKVTAIVNGIYKEATFVIEVGGSSVTPPVGGNRPGGRW